MYYIFSCTPASLLLDLEFFFPLLLLSLVVLDFELLLELDDLLIKYQYLLVVLPDLSCLDPFELPQPLLDLLHLFLDLECLFLLLLLLPKKSRMLSMSMLEADLSEEVLDISGMDIKLGDPPPSKLVGIAVGSRALMNSVVGESVLISVGIGVSAGCGLSSTTGISVGVKVGTSVSRKMGGSVGSG